MSPSLVQAAGCVVWRYGSREPEVLLVHRPRYDDWSYPKGKLNRGESPAAAAVREVEEETGLRVRLGPRLPDQEYPVSGGKLKRVSYWAAPAPPRANITGYQANREVDGVRWVELKAARKLMSYDRDMALLDTFMRSAYDSTPLLILRHTKARRRKTWKGDDGDRPLLAEGRAHARHLVPVLDAYGISRVVTSDAARCVESVLPYVSASDAQLTIGPDVSEQGYTEKKVRRVVQHVLASEKRVVLCSHRPVLPSVFDALGLEPVSLAPGGLVAVHRQDSVVLALDEV